MLGQFPNYFRLISGWKNEEYTHAYRTFLYHGWENEAYICATLVHFLAERLKVLANATLAKRPVTFSAYKQALLSHPFFLTPIFPLLDFLVWLHLEGSLQTVIFPITLVAFEQALCISSAKRSELWENALASLFECGSHVTSRNSPQILKKDSLLVGYNTRTFPLTPVVQQSITLLTALLLACVHPPPPAVFREL